MRIEDSFWTPYTQLVTKQILPYQYQVLQDALPDVPESHCIENFRIAAGEAEGQFRVKLPEAKAKVLKEQGYVGKRVVMGIRPEDIYDSEHDLAQHPDSQMEVKITGYELLGSEVLLYFGLRNEKPTEKHRQFSDEDDSNVKKALFTAKVDARTTARYGSKIIVALDPEKIHVFDKETEQAIVH